MYEDEEFQPYSFGFSMAEERNISSLLNFLKDSEADASRMARKAKDGKIDESSDEKNGWAAVSARLKFLRLFLSVLSTLSNIDVNDSTKGELEKLNSSFQQIQSLTKVIDDSYKLGNKTVLHSDNVTLPLVSYLFVM